MEIQKLIAQEREMQKFTKREKLRKIKDSIMLTLLFAGIVSVGSLSVSKLAKSSEIRNSEFKLNEHKVLGTSKFKGNAKGEGKAFNMIIDVNNNSYYDMDEDILISIEDEEIASLVQPLKKIVYITKDYQKKIDFQIVAVENEKNDYIVVKKPTEIYNEKLFQSNESFKNINRFFQEKYVNQK